MEPAADRLGAGLAPAVRARRKSLGLTQKELGRFAGCGVAFIYDLEQGKPSIRMDKLAAVLEVLGLRLAVEQGADLIRVDPALTPPGDEPR